jgi:hypothetical protein
MGGSLCLTEESPTGGGTVVFAQTGNGKSTMQLEIGTQEHANHVAPPPTWKVVADECPSEIRGFRITTVRADAVESDRVELTFRGKYWLAVVPLKSVVLLEFACTSGNVRVRLGDSNV